jgi:hypothetical protein
MSWIGERGFRIFAGACLATLIFATFGATGRGFQTARGAIVFRGATVIDGTGRPPIVFSQHPRQR